MTTTTGPTVSEYHVTSPDGIRAEITPALPAAVGRLVRDCGGYGVRPDALDRKESVYPAPSSDFLATIAEVAGITIIDDRQPDALRHEPTMSLEDTRTMGIIRLGSLAIPPAAA